MRRDRVLPTYELHMLLAPNRWSGGSTAAEQRYGVGLAAGATPARATTLLPEMRSVTSRSEVQRCWTAGT